MTNDLPQYAEPKNGSHFENKEPIRHVVERRAEGIVSLSESHGTEMPGLLSAGADAIRETAVLFFLLSLLFSFLHLSSLQTLKSFGAFSIAWILWKMGRSAWLGWSRLERLHRTIEQEKFEIENHRPQEREELKVIYKAKGFEGTLLEDVLDVLMADKDRLLKIMLEEELGLTLEAYEHPLKQSLGAAGGSFLTAAFCLSFFALFSLYGMLIACLLMIGGAAFLSARYEKNAFTPALVWTVALSLLCWGFTYFILKLI